jgi:hypothetical protein
MKKYLIILGPAVAVLTALAAAYNIDVQPIKDAVCGKAPVSVPLTDAGVP